MLARVYAAGLHGLGANVITVEVDESFGLPRSVIVGNVSASVREALERCTVAMKNVDLELPPRRLTVNLQPADLRKDGTGFDLAILVGMLSALELCQSFWQRDYAFLGELGLDGRILHVRGILSLVSACKKADLKGAIVPVDDVQEALSVEGMDILAVPDITALLPLLQSEKNFLNHERTVQSRETAEEQRIPDFSDVCGQEFAIRAALIAAAGGHHLLLSGVAGAGKSMIAKRVPGILPELSHEEKIELTKLYSVAGLLRKGQGLIHSRPFRSPHHTITSTSLVGGAMGARILPGELALSSKGVLFLDELPLFSKSSLEALREPLEERQVHIQRLCGSFSYVFDCLMVAAMNPCPCGYFPDRTRCRCTPGQIRSYQRGISKPILERIDLCVELRPVDFMSAVQGDGRHSTKELRKKVLKARERQRERFNFCSSIHLNRDMDYREMGKFCALGAEEEEFMRRVFEKKRLSMRSYHKILKVSRTIADLEGAAELGIRHLTEAVNYRSLEDSLFPV